MAEEKETPNAENPEAANDAPQKEETAPAAAKAEAATPAPKEEAAKDEKPAPPRNRDVVAEALGLDDDIPQKIVKAKGSKNISQGVAHIRASFNNTQVTISDTKGNVLSWSTSGKCGFRGSKKSTAYVAQVVAQDACRRAMSHGLKEVEVRIKGPGTGRESAVRALQSIGLEVTSIRDVTPIPHNGCRLRKARRV